MKKGQKTKEDTKEKMRIAKLGKKRAPFSLETKQKMSLARIGRFGGENHPNWQGGISTIKDKARHTREMKFWRKSILERDNFICQKTFISGGKLVAHHINNFSEFPDKLNEIPAF